MKKFLLTILALLLLSPNVYALNLSMSPIHFADNMEFYYRTPKPEIIAPLLKSFSESNYLNQAENRLLMGGFLAQLLLARQLTAEKLIQTCAPLGKNARRACAWALHLAGESDKKALKLLDKDDTLLARQISRSPSALINWNPASEPAILHMYWGAFMADGKPVWIDAIVDVANPENKFKQEDSATKEARRLAAASLYDYAPRHTQVLDRLKTICSSKTGSQAEMLKIIIDHAEQKQKK